MFSEKGVDFVLLEKFKKRNVRIAFIIWAVNMAGIIYFLVTSAKPDCLNSILEFLGVTFMCHSLSLSNWGNRNKVKKPSEEA